MNGIPSESRGGASAPLVASGVSDDPEAVRVAVLARYGPVAERVRWVALGAGGGFSGACVWRGDDDSGTPLTVLKAWPGTVTTERLIAIHSRMVQAAQLPFVPAVYQTTDKQSVVIAGGRPWDLCRWMLGAADYHFNPTPARLANAAAALAQIHQVWRPPAPVLAPSASIRFRLKFIAKWRDLSTGPCVPLRPCTPELEEAIRFGWRVARVAAEPTERRLRDWDEWPVFVQPCLRDVWGEHVLFTGDAVTGVIDYGSVKTDHVAVDLARLLGDLVEDDEDRFAAALDAYRAAGGALEVPNDFVRVLDRTGAVTGVMNWLMRLCGSDYAHPDPAAIAARLTRLAARVERLFPG